MPKQSKTTQKPKTKTNVTATSQITTKKKTGAPNQYACKIKPYMADIERYAKCGVTEGQLCEFYGVGKTQWCKYKKDNPELTEILFNAKEQLKTDLINKSYEVAMGYEYEEETIVTYKDKDGAVTGTKTTRHKRQSKADAGMLQFLLINRYPAEYARDPQTIELRKRALELAEQGKISFSNEEGI